MENSAVTIPRGQISILAGASGAGKTTLLLQSLAAWARGEVFLPELTWDASRVLYVASDRTVEEAKIIAERVGLPSDQDKITFYGLVDDPKLPSGLLNSPRALLQYITTDKTYDLMILDPIGIFMDGSINNYKNVAMSLYFLNQFAKQHNITILAMHHTSKARTDFTFQRPQDRISGSGALLGYSATQMVLISPEELKGDFFEFHVISHTRPAMMVFMIRGQDGKFHVEMSGVPEGEIPASVHPAWWKQRGRR